MGADTAPGSGDESGASLNGGTQMIEIQGTGIVYENPKPNLRSQHAFHPTIVDFGAGELLCAYDLGEAVESLDYCTYVSRSLDGGKTWRFEGPVIGTPGRWASDR